MCHKCYDVIILCWFYLRRESDAASSSSTSDVVVKDLSRALLQIAMGIDDRFLLLPLGKNCTSISDFSFQPVLQNWCNKD